MKKAQKSLVVRTVELLEKLPEEIRRAWEADNEALELFLCGFYYPPKLEPKKNVAERRYILKPVVEANARAEARKVKPLTGTKLTRSSVMAGADVLPFRTTN
jgi:hypothetical protein